MLKYIFTPEQDLPPDVGFAEFGPGHLMMLALMAVISAAVVYLGCRMEERGRRRLLLFLAISMVVMELGLDAVLIYLDAFSVGYLPLHLCSFSMFLCLWFACCPSSDLAGQLVWSLCFPAGVAALLTPDWTNMPLLQFQSVHSFIYHAIMVQFSLIAVISGMVKPRLGGIWKTMAFLVAAAAVIYCINLRLRTNFMFLNWPVPGTPLMLCAELPGKWGYLIGYAVLVLCVLVLMNLPFSVWEWRKTRREAK